MKSAVIVLAASGLITSFPTAAAEPTGKGIFDHYCAACHGASNEAPGTLQLRRTRGQDNALLAERSDLKAPYIEYVVRHGLRAMPAFVPSDLTDSKLKALTEFLGH
jgi:(+)-pinoresinol hydroxylase